MHRESAPATTAQYRYQVEAEIRYHDDLGEYLTCRLKSREKTTSGWRLVETLHDVSNDVSFARQLAYLFNLFQLHPLHLKDAVEDLLP